MPMDTRDRSTKQGSRPPSQVCRVEPTHNRKGIKVMQDTSYSTTTTNAKVTIRSLTANLPEYSVPLTAAVTYNIDGIVGVCVLVWYQWCMRDDDVFRSRALYESCITCCSSLQTTTDKFIFDFQHS